MDTRDSGTNDPLPTERLIFSATMMPHRSLGRKGMMIVVGLTTLICMISAAPFVMMGAWPIGGFFGLDVLLLYGAFRLNNQRARAYEELLLSRIALIFRKTSWRGVARVWQFNPRWVTLSHESDPDFGMMRLTLQQGPSQVDVGAFLPPCERADFAQALRRALAEARRG